jgi:hypothetical protein
VIDDRMFSAGAAARSQQVGTGRRASVLIAIVAGVLLERALYYQEYAEMTAMKMTVANMRSGLRYKVADLIMNNRLSEYRDTHRRESDQVAIFPAGELHGRVRCRPPNRDCGKVVFRPDQTRIGVHAKQSAPLCAVQRRGFHFAVSGDAHSGAAGPSAESHSFANMGKVGPVAAVEEDALNVGTERALTPKILGHDNGFRSTGGNVMEQHRATEYRKHIAGFT